MSVLSSVFCDYAIGLSREVRFLKLRDESACIALEKLRFFYFVNAESIVSAELL